ncbi:hypothetical protein K438DRAFT_1762504 [Mycena galopus ATCC 62051]|nr:hypothetical protein K438DRAFT_1762504 [Mycena galopus ATCC 62051]
MNPWLESRPRTPFRLATSMLASTRKDLFTAIGIHKPPTKISQEGFQTNLRQTLTKLMDSLIALPMVQKKWLSFTMTVCNFTEVYTKSKPRRDELSRVPEGGTIGPLRRLLRLTASGLISPLSALLWWGRADCAAPEAARRESILQPEVPPADHVQFLTGRTQEIYCDDDIRNGYEHHGVDADRLEIAWKARIIGNGLRLVEFNARDERDDYKEWNDDYAPPWKPAESSPERQMSLDGFDAPQKKKMSGVAEPFGYGPRKRR